METTTIGSLTVSKQGLGCMGLSAFYDTKLSYEEGVKVIKAAFDAGVTHFDTAWVYRSRFDGDPDTNYNETMLGMAIKEIGRDKVTVATKIMPNAGNDGKMDVDSVRAVLKGCLERLQMDYVDLWYLHRPPEPTRDVTEFVASSKKLVEEGLCKEIGLSEVNAKMVRDACAIHPIAAVQNEYSLICRELEAELFPTLKELNVTLVAYSPLARAVLGGEVKSPEQWDKNDWRINAQPRMNTKENLETNLKLLAPAEEMAAKKGISLAQLSLAWMYGQAKKIGVKCVPIPGSSKVKNILSNVAAASITLSDSEVDELSNAVDYRSVIGARYGAGMMAACWETRESTVDKDLVEKAQAALKA